MANLFERCSWAEYRVVGNQRAMIRKRKRGGKGRKNPKRGVGAGFDHGGGGFSNGVPFPKTIAEFHSVSIS